MEDIELQQKQAKAKIYATQPERFDLHEIALTMQSEHGTRQIAYKGGAWHCTCEFFAERGTCSHILAVRHLLGGIDPTRA